MVQEQTNQVHKRLYLHQDQKMLRDIVKGKQLWDGEMECSETVLNLVYYSDVSSIRVCVFKFRCR